MRHDLMGRRDWQMDRRTGDTGLRPYRQNYEIRFSKLRYFQNLLRRVAAFDKTFRLAPSFCSWRHKLSKKFLGGFHCLMNENQVTRFGLSDDM